MQPLLFSEERLLGAEVSSEQAGGFYERLLEKLASLDKFQHVIRSTESMQEAISLGLQEVQSLIAFKICGIYLVDDKEGLFQFADCLPSDGRQLLEERVGREIASGTFAWALRQTRPVILPGNKTEPSLLFCVLSTRAQTLGMFAGIIGEGSANTADDSLGLLSLVLLGVTYTLENHNLVQQLRTYNEHLQDLVSQRSAQIMETNIQLQKEIEERQLREEELRAAKEVVEAADRSKSEFLAMMSHEIRTPMNGVIGFTNILESTPLNEEQMECVRLLNLSSQQLLCLLNDVLDLSKIEAGQLYLEHRPFQLRELIHDLLDLSVLRARERQVELSCDIDDLVPETMVGDSTRLRQIVMNLLTNALKFTEKGEICLLVEYKTDESLRAPYLLWTVEDTGIGIAPDKIGQLFQPFKQADSSTTRKFGGTGLGLAICRKLCEKMGGRIWVESQIGRGSLFRFTLPLSMACVPEMAGQLPLQGLTITVVSPFEMQRRYLQKRLLSWGAQVVTPDFEDQKWLENGQHFVVIDSELFSFDQKMEELADRLSGHSGIVLIDKRGQRTLYGQMLGPNWSFILKPLYPETLQKQIMDASGLRVVEVKPTPKPREPEPLAVTKSSSNIRIILADDNVINQKIAQKMFTKLGYRVRVVSNGLEVLAALRTGPCDVVFLDLEMPEMDGRTTARAIRSGDGGDQARQVHLIAMTAHGETERASCLDAGMNEFLSKPVRMDDLQKLLAEVPLV